MIAVVYGIGDLRVNTTGFIPGYTIVESVFYHCFHKAAWSLALAWIVFSCVNGYGGKQNSANNLLLNKGKYHCTADICFTDLDLVVLLNTNKNIVW